MATSSLTRGSAVTVDESPSLQNLLATPSVAGDSNDNDIAATSLPAVFSVRLAEVNAGTPLNVALSGYNGSNTGTSAVTYTVTGTANNISFTDSLGAPLNNVDSGLKTAAGDSIFLFSDTANDNILYGKAGTAIVFAAYLEEVSSPATGAKIWMTEYQAIQHPNAADPDDSLNLLNKVFVSIDSSQAFSLANAPSGQNLFLTLGDASAAIVVTGKLPANQSTGVNVSTGDTVNTSQGGGSTTIGDNNQMIDPTEGMYFTFVTGANTGLTIPNLDHGEAVLESNIQFTGLLEARAASFSIVQLQSGKSATVKITAYSANSTASGDQYVDQLQNNTARGIDRITVKDAAGVVDPSVSINLATGVIVGIKAGYTIEYHTTANHDRLLVENTGAGANKAAFDIGGFSLLQSNQERLEVGSLMQFEDDGPSVATTGTPPTLTVDETVLATNDTKSFASSFNSSFGADGAGTAGLTYALGVSAAGADSGLVDTATSQHVFLYKDATTGVVSGRVGAAGAADPNGLIVFQVSVDTAGAVTLDQQRAVVHPVTTNPDDSVSLSATLVTLTATATDRDGDAASASRNIGNLLNFKDDGPSVSTTGTLPTLTVDETVLATNATAGFAANFSPSFGADGAGTTGVTYALGVSATGADSGLVDTTTGHHVYLYKDATTGVVSGRVGAAAAADPGGLIAFQVSVSTAGVVTLDQQRAVVHPVTTNPDDSVSLSATLVTLTAAVTDKDGDSGSTAVNIGNLLVFRDDGPSAFTPNSITLTNTGTAVGTEALHTAGTFGADGAGAGTFVDGNTADNFLYATNGTTLLKSGGENIVLSGFGSGTLVATTATTGATVFTATLNVGADTYTVDFDRAIDDGAGVSFLGAAPVKSGNPTFNIINNVGGTTMDLLFSGGDTNNGLPTSHSVNVSTTGAGVDNQSMNATSGLGETLRIDFEKDAVLAGSPNGSDFTPGTHVTVNGYSFMITQNTPSATTATVFVKAFDADDDKTLVGDSGDVVDPITQVKVGNTIIFGTGAVSSATINGQTVTAVGVNNGVVITGLSEGNTGDGVGGDDPIIKVYTANGFNRVETSNYAGQTVNGVVLGGTSFDLAPAGVEQAVAGTATEFSLPVMMTDADGDPGPVELIGVNLTPVPLA
ncbi:MAG: hypothetical protein JWR21_2122 [Herminiimonas sp.]|nr:hypothetical protein [Herminiimonas sp.]MDB5854331.1 hypothetical protein [Herminiimonas sp.]